MNVLSLISLIIIVSVVVFVNRIYSRIKKQHFFIRKLMTKIGTFHLIFLFLMYLKFFLQPLQLWFLSFSSLLVLPLVFFLLMQFHQHQFYSEFLRFLSLLILKMQMGYAYRSAYERVLKENHWTYRVLLQQIYENVTFSQQELLPKYGNFGQFMGQIHSVLSAVQSYPHQSIDRLCNFRDQLIQDRFFRRKSRQIWINLGLQFVVLSLIYWVIFVYICFEYSFSKYSNVFSLSLSLYFFGLLVLFLMSRGKKWHI